MKKPAVKLNIACGPNVFPYDGWINYDKANFNQYFEHLRNAPLVGMPEHQQAVALWVRLRAAAIVRHHDVTKPFTQHADSSVDFIYCGQMIEHLNRRTQVVPFLKECYRMLKPGGVLRMTTPNLDDLWPTIHGYGKYAADQPEWFREATASEQFCYLAFGASGPYCTQTNYEGHMFLYSKASLSKALLEAGFAEPSFAPQERPEIRDEGMSHSLCVEATK
jgi:SAM-dependent methyltransferase